MLPFWVIWVVLSHGEALSQEVRMYGYSLGDQADQILEVRGKPDLTKKTNKEVHWIYFLNKNQETYLVFSFSKSRPDFLSGIQVTGKGKLEEPLLRGLHLGNSRKVVEEVFGKPDLEEKVEKINGILSRYSNRNFSFEYIEDQLYSVRIHRNVFLPRIMSIKNFSL